MAASKDTLTEVLRVVMLHTDLETARKIFKDLLQVQGNESFRKSIINVNKILDKDNKSGWPEVKPCYYLKVTRRSKDA